MSPHTTTARTGDIWFFAGLLSSFPNLTESGTAVLCEPRASNNGDSVPGCKVFQVPSTDSTQAKQIEGDEMTSYNGVVLRDQVLVFRYKDKVHAVDNVRKQHQLSSRVSFSILNKCLPM